LGKSFCHHTGAKIIKLREEKISHEIKGTLGMFQYLDWERVLARRGNSRAKYFYFCSHKCAGRVSEIQFFGEEFFTSTKKLLRFLFQKYIDSTKLQV